MDNNNTTQLIRLNRFLAQCGLGARRQCDGLIRAGLIYVNGKKVTELGVKINPQSDLVSHQGKPLKKAGKLEYIAYHKSRGSVVTASDPQGRETIYDALKKQGHSFDHLKYVGRLDRNSEGLLLLTNDGDLVHALTHPRFQIKKVYHVKSDKALLEEHANQMVFDGVMSDGLLLRAAAISRLTTPEHAHEYWYCIDLFEGRNRQIRRMFEACGYEVLRLKRVQYSVIKLHGIKRGDCRQLSEREIKALKSKGYS